MDCDYRNVSLAHISEEDQRFRISTPGQIETLCRSIQKVGLINAPTLLPRDNALVVVSGFARVAACRSLGWAHLTARCLPAQAEPLQAALIAISDNRSQRALNLLEMARAWALLEQVTGSPEKAMQQAHAIDLAMNIEMVSKLRQVMQMDAPLQRALIEGGIALPIALRLHAMSDAAAARELAALFGELQLSLNRQRELLDWIQGIAGREGLHPHQVIAADPIPGWRQAQMDRGQKTNLIRQYLKRRRYPEITAFEERYQTGVRELKLVEGMQLAPPSNFEGQTYTLQMAFKSAAELGRLCAEAQRVADSIILKKIVNPASSDTV